jgi:SAM-dependent methyltransferase
MLLYALTILVSAFLLFQVQPVIAKIILPWFGGSAAVWATCLLFFQLVLLLGYLYAHASIRYLKPRRQMLLHIGLLALSLVVLIVLPVYPSAAWKPSGTADPTWGILSLLGATVGLPYFLLSTTGPLLQAWYARRYHGAIPYRLYALSNVGSMFALLSYPFLFEPFFGSHRQAGMWSVGYCVFFGLCVFTAIRSGTAPQAEPEAEAATADPIETPGPRQYVFWLLLPACASALLLAVTNHISQNIAAIPLLWIAPLSLYLLSFILCFEGRGWYQRFPYLPLLAVFLAAMAMYMNGYEGPTVVLGIHLKTVYVAVGLFLLGLFSCCMVCHGELVRLKPHPRYLTHFYLTVSAGGALGGLLVAFVAPHLFNSFYEFPLGLMACAVLTLIVLRANPGPDWFRQFLSPARTLAAAAAVGVVGYFGWDRHLQIIDWAHDLAHLVAKAWTPPNSFDNYAIRAALLIVSVVVLMVLRADWGLGWVKTGGGWYPFGIEIVALTIGGYLMYQVGESTTGHRLMVRNFYGGLKITDTGPATAFDSVRRLTHGTINHGEQFLNPARRDQPTTYYGPGTGVGVAIRDKGRSHAIRVGVIGLGTGTIAAYGRLGDYYRYYEINPLVPQISNAGAASQFTFLTDCKCKVEVAMGDARLSLEREQPEDFDVLAVDAFSSDSIPVHLLTKEAMQLYFRHLKPDGILAVHISNRYLDLQPVMEGEAKATGHIARLVDTDDDTSEDVFSATWVLVTAPSPGFDSEVISNSTQIASTRTVRLWTDDYSNLFQILK